MDGRVTRGKGLGIPDGLAQAWEKPFSDNLSKIRINHRNIQLGGQNNFHFNLATSTHHLIKKISDQTANEVAILPLQNIST